MPRSGRSEEMDALLRASERNASRGDRIAELARENERLRAENERLMRVYGAANVVVAVLGCHGEIYARDDRVSALMDALHDVDGGVPNANSASDDGIKHVD